MRTKVLLMAFAIAAIAGIALISWISQESMRSNRSNQVQSQPGSDLNPTSPSTPPVAQSPTADSIAPGSNYSDHFLTGLENMPASFRGTKPDGKWQQDSQGNLVINKDIVHIFNYFFSAQGEEPLDRCVARVQAHINYQLTDPAASQAKQLLSDFIALNNRISTLNSVASSPPGTPEQLADRLQMISELRQSYLSPGVAEIFYADEESLDQFTLNKIKIEHNNRLTATEKSNQIEQLESQLPEEIQQSLDNTRIVLKLNQLTAKLSNARDSEEKAHRLRAEMVGEEAAERLQELDNKRAQWQTNLESWLTTRSKLKNNPQLSALDKEQQISQLREDYFNSNDIRRVMALERIHDTDQ